MQLNPASPTIASSGGVVLGVVLALRGWQRRTP